jgi:GNAT superfamily N-acetyltransferase
MSTIPFTVRGFASSDADYAHLVAIDQQAWPGEPVSLDGLKFDDEEWDDALFFERRMVDVAGQTIGYAQWSETPWAYEPDKYFVKIMIAPAFGRRGIGSALYAQIESELAQRGARLLTATTREDQPYATRFVTQRGFVQQIRELESRLDVAAFDASAFTEACERVNQAGIRIASMRALQGEDSRWLEQWWALKEALMRDVPTSETFTPETLDELAASLESPQIDLDAVFVAVDTASSKWIGLSSVALYPESPEVLYVGLTGVLPAYRRRGIALALKVCTVLFAQAYGAEVIIGENEENNPMYALNLKLGFKPGVAWLGYEKRLDAPR